jgi:hypothetical protein
VQQERLLRTEQLVGQAAVSEEQAQANRAAGKSPVRPRPAREGLLPFSRPTLWRKVKAGEFPAPIKIGALTVWRSSDVAAWINAPR